MRSIQPKPGQNAQLRNDHVKPKQELVSELTELSAWVPEEMEPGSIFLLSNRDELRRQHGPQSYWAVLACPKCGTLGLITEPQYRGTDSVICGSPVCACHFFIQDQARFDLLPAQ